MFDGIFAAALLIGKGEVNSFVSHIPDVPGAADIHARAVRQTIRENVYSAADIPYRLPDQGSYPVPRHPSSESAEVGQSQVFPWVLQVHEILRGESFRGVVGSTWNVAPARRMAAPRGGVHDAHDGSPFATSCSNPRRAASAWSFSIVRSCVNATSASNSSCSASPRYSFRSPRSRSRRSSAAGRLKSAIRSRALTPRRIADCTSGSARGVVSSSRLVR